MGPAVHIIRHRLNDLGDLRSLGRGLGAEVDLRSRGDRIVLNHEPFADGPDLEDFLDLWAAAPDRGPLILNPKEDGLEGAALSACARRGIDDWFFLDLPMPTMVRLAVREGFRKIAVRVSAWEPADAALRFAGLADWAWLDCFDGVPPDPATAALLASRFRVCLVSPELQGCAPDRIPAFRPLAAAVHAVCTKHPRAWGWDA